MPPTDNIDQEISIYSEYNSEDSLRPEAQPLVDSSPYLTRNDEHVMKALNSASYTNDHLPEFIVIGLISFLIAIGVIMMVNSRKRPRSDEYSVQEQQQTLNTET